MSGLKLYADSMSPVCRSVMLFLAANDISYESVHVNLGNPESVKQNSAVVAINPNLKLPSLDDNGFKLFESVAILRYLATKFNTPDHWYPKDLQTRAKVDEALAWFPGNLRSGLFPHAVKKPKMTGQPRDETIVAECTRILKKSLDVIESYFLKDKPFIAGDHISIADLQFVSQMTHYWLVGRDIYQGRPNTERWVKACQEYLAPHFDSVYQAVYHHREAGTFSAQSQLDL